ARQQSENAQGAGPQLGVGRAHVHHQAAVGLAQQHEGGGGDGVEGDLGGGARLQTGGAGDHLGAGGELDDHVGGRLAVAGGGQLAAGDEHGGGAAVVGVFQGCAHERGDAGGGDAQH